MSKIAREVGVSCGTVSKYIAVADLSPEPPARSRRGRLLGPYRPLIESWLDSDRATWPKQRHTARRIWARLAEEEGVRVGESTVQGYVRMLRADHREPGEGFLDFDWAPGTAQADFGEADFLLRGVHVRLSFFVLSFPYSNVGVAQVFGGEAAECVC